MTKRKRKPRVRLYSSEALDLSGLPAKHHDYARLFVHRLISRRIFDRRLRGREYIAMDSRIIRQYIPVRHVKPVLDYLVETGQVEKTGYSEGQSTRYRLSDELHRSRCTIYPPKVSSIARKLWRVKEDQRKQANTRKRPVHHHLDLWLKRVLVDEKAAMKFISDQQTMMMSWLDENNLSWFSELPIVSEKLAEDRLHAEASVQAIVLNDMYQLPCNYGRYHTNISSLRKELRSFLSINGQSLIEVDVCFYRERFSSRC